jgi:hypothetical protein
MTTRLLPVWGVLVLAGCAGGDSAPPALASDNTPEVLFLVRNEVFAIHLSGQGRRSLGKVGDDRHRTGYPRFLPDGRVAVLADETGGIFPWFASNPGGDWTRITLMNVTMNDSLTATSVGGAPWIIFTTSPYSDGLPLTTRVYRVDVDNPQLEAVGFQGTALAPGSISEPAPYDDGRILAVRSTRPDINTPGISTIEILKVDTPDIHDPAKTTEQLVTLDPGYLARSPALLADGRVAFVQVDPSGVSDTAVGELFVIGLDNQVRSTEITGVLGLIAVGDKLVYEEGGALGVSDLVVTDLEHPGVNLTHTADISEHLTWSD